MYIISMLKNIYTQSSAEEKHHLPPLPAPVCEWLQPGHADAPLDILHRQQKCKYLSPL